MPPDRELRPQADDLEASKSKVATGSLDSLTALDDIARHVDGTFVVVVKVSGPEPKYRRRCFMSAKSAENAVRRAVGRGETATVYLAELRPLWKVRGGDGS